MQHVLCDERALSCAMSVFGMFLFFICSRVLLYASLGGSQESTRRASCCCRFFFYILFQCVPMNVCLSTVYTLCTKGRLLLHSHTHTIRCMRMHSFSDASYIFARSFGIGVGQMIKSTKEKKHHKVKRTKSRSFLPSSANSQTTFFFAFWSRIFLSVSSISFCLFSLLKGFWLCEDGSALDFLVFFYANFFLMQGNFHDIGTDWNEHGKAFWGEEHKEESAAIRQRRW